MPNGFTELMVHYAKADRGVDPREEPERTDDAKLKVRLDKADIFVTTEIHALLRHSSRGLQGCC